MVKNMKANKDGLLSKTLISIGAILLVLSPFIWLILLNSLPLVDNLCRTGLFGEECAYTITAPSENAFTIALSPFFLGIIILIMGLISKDAVSLWVSKLPWELIILIVSAVAFLVVLYIFGQAFGWDPDNPKSLISPT